MSAQAKSRRPPRRRFQLPLTVKFAYLSRRKRRSIRAQVRPSSLAASAHDRAVDLPDEFYETTVEDLIRNAEIEKKMKLEWERENATLRTREQRERDRQRKWAKFTKCLVRIRFPDLTELQGTFGSLETMGAIYEFVHVRSLP